MYIFSMKCDEFSILAAIFASSSPCIFRAIPANAELSAKLPTSHERANA